MPHLIFEASANIIASNDKIKQTMRDCQNLLVEKLPSQLSSCKSRLILHDLFVVGDDKNENAFIHLTVKVLAGRSAELLKAVALQLKDILSNDFARCEEQLNLTISVEIATLNDNYVT